MSQRRWSTRRVGLVEEGLGLGKLLLGLRGGRAVATGAGDVCGDVPVGGEAVFFNRGII